MDSVIMKTLDWWRTSLSLASRHNSGSLSSQKRVLKRTGTHSFIKLAATSLFLGAIPSFAAIADDGGNCGCQASCSPCSQPGKCAILGNGLLDFLDKFTSQGQGNCGRSRTPSGCSATGCESGCNSSCDSLGSGIEISGFTTNQSGTSDSMTSHSSSNASNSGQSMNAGQIHTDNAHSLGPANSSPVPMPIPDTNASPLSMPSMPSMPIQAPSVPTKVKPGNPFLDEARSKPSPVQRSAELLTNSSSRRRYSAQNAITQKPEATESISLSSAIDAKSLPSSFQKQQVVVKKSSVRPAPPSQIHGSPGDKSKVGWDAHMGLNDQVITAGSIESLRLSEAQFAR